MNATSAPLSCHADIISYHCCGSHISYLGRTIVCLSLLKACMVPSGAMRASAQGGGSQDSSSSGASGPCS